MSDPNRQEDYGQPEELPQQEAQIFQFPSPSENTGPIDIDNQTRPERLHNDLLKAEINIPADQAERLLNLAFEEFSERFLVNAQYDHRVDADVARTSVEEALRSTKKDILEGLQT